jgi:hypothetical protein
VTGFSRLGQIARIAPLASLLAFAFTACGGSSGNSFSVAVPRFEPGACPSSVASLPELANAKCGKLVVPENRTKANGNTFACPLQSYHR